MTSKPAYVMKTPSEISQRDGNSKQAVAKSVKKMLAAHPSTPVERDSRGRVMKVSLAAYDEFRGIMLDPVQVRKPSGLPSPENNTFDAARLEGQLLKNDRDRIRMDEEIGLLVRRDIVESSLLVAGKEISSVIMRLQNNADDLAVAVSKEGVHGARLVLRKIALEMGNDIADRLVTIFEDAPPQDARLSEKT